MKPSIFSKVDPMGSVFKKSEHETVAQNIMTILKRTGDEWKPLTWEEYKEERLKDGDFSDGEKRFFEDVIGYCKSPDTAIPFSPQWKNLAK